MVIKRLSYNRTFMELKFNKALGSNVFGVL